MCSEPFKHIKSRGNRNIIEDQNGYKFSFYQSLKTGEISWRCSKRCKLGCKVYVHTLDDLIIRKSWNHNHGPDYDVYAKELPDLPLKIEME